MYSFVFACICTCIYLYLRMYIIHSFYILYITHIHTYMYSCAIVHYSFVFFTHICTSCIHLRLHVRSTHPLINKRHSREANAIRRNHFHFGQSFKIHRRLDIGARLGFASRHVMYVHQTRSHPRSTASREHNRDSDSLANAERQDKKQALRRNQPWAVARETIGVNRRKAATLQFSRDAALFRAVTSVTSPNDRTLSHFCRAREPSLSRPSFPSCSSVHSALRLTVRARNRRFPADNRQEIRRPSVALYSTFVRLVRGRFPRVKC